jgi:hypothetical protein
MEYYGGHTRGVGSMVGEGGGPSFRDISSGHWGRSRNLRCVAPCFGLRKNSSGRSSYMGQTRGGTQTERYPDLNDDTKLVNFRSVPPQVPTVTGNDPNEIASVTGDRCNVLPLG